MQDLTLKFVPVECTFTCSSKTFKMGLWQNSQGDGKVLWKHEGHRKWTRFWYWQSALRDIDTIGEACLQFLSTPNFIHQQNEAISKQNNHFKTHCALNRATRAIWRKGFLRHCLSCIKRTLNLSFKKLELSFFSHKCTWVMQFCGKRKITLNYAMFININGSCQCLQIKTFMSDFSSVYCSILSKMVCTFFDDFL